MTELAPRLVHTSLIRTAKSGVLATAVALSVLAGSTATRAAEFAQSTYLLGIGSSLSGLTPPPGFYFQNDSYFYKGSIKGNRQLSFGPALTVDVEQRTWLDVLTGVYVTPAEVLGGNLGFAVSLPVGAPRVSADLQANLPRLNRTFGARITERDLNAGDFYLQSFIGWHSGDLHWQLGVTGVVPSGTYDRNSISNVSLNRPAVDVFGAFTWLDMTKGHELSAKAGFTFNGVNTDNNYNTGNEFHLEWAAMQHFSQSFALGLVGYFYDQVTGDSGQGARLGPFKGRVIALGGEVDFSFKLSELPVTTKLKIYREFDVENRFQGTVGMITVAMPLYVVPPAQVAKPITAKY